MTVVSREYFTVDLRGLRGALTARAVRDGVTQSDVLRSSLAGALGISGGDLSDSSIEISRSSPYVGQVKLSVRVSRPAACRLDQDVRASGLSRGAYLARLIQGAPPVASSANRIAMCSALNRSSEELAVMSRDINHLTQLLREGSIAAAKSYVVRHETLDRDVRAHLALAGAVLADLSAMRLVVNHGVK